MFVLALAFVFGLGAPASAGDVNGNGGTRFSTIAQDMPEPLHKSLMDKVDGMSAANQGIFNEDVSTMVEGYFPRGQTIEDTKKVVSAKGLGHLEPFKGKMSVEDGAMYVTRFTLMSKMYSHVFVVVDFKYSPGPSGDLVLDHAQAFLRSSNM